MATHLVGYDASELYAMRSKQKEVKAIEDMLAEIIQNFRRKLTELNSFMRIRFNNNDDVVVVEELIEMTDSNKKMLLSKIEDEKLPTVVF